MEPEKETTNMNGAYTPEHEQATTPPQEAAPTIPEMTTEEPVALLEAAPFYRSKAFLVKLLIVVVILAGGGYYAYTNGVFEPAVAEVNGVKISQSEFDEGVDLIEKNAIAQGIDLSEVDAEGIIRQQVLDVLILNTLIKAAAEDLGIKVTQEEVDEKYVELISAMEGQLELGETVASKMAEVGITEKKLKDTLMEQIVADKYIEATTDIEGIQISEEEIAEFYVAISANTPDVPPLEEIKDQVSAQLRSDKQQQLIGTVLEKLRSEADITINI